MGRIASLLRRCLPFRLVAGLLLVGLATAGTAQSDQTRDLRVDVLIDAIGNRDTVRAEAILASGVDLNISDNLGRTPLTEAIARHLPVLAMEVIDYGANVNLRPPRQFSPLMSAAWYCEREVVDSLLSHGAVVDARDEDGTTALIGASGNCKGGRIVQALLLAGADPNAATKNGYTGLIAAAETGNVAAVRELIAAGADVNAKNSEGETALSIVETHPFRTKAHERIGVLLRNASKQSRQP